MAQFGEILAELRQDRGLSQAELAKIIYVTAGTISNYENGIHFPDVEKLIAIANYFQVSTDYLLGRVNSPLSPDAFNENIFPHVTTGELIVRLKSLSPERRKALQVIFQDMLTSTYLAQSGKGGHS